MGDPPQENAPPTGHYAWSYQRLFWSQMFEMHLFPVPLALAPHLRSWGSVPGSPPILTPPRQPSFPRSPVPCCFQALAHPPASQEALLGFLDASNGLFTQVPVTWCPSQGVPHPVDPPPQHKVHPQNKRVGRNGWLQGVLPGPHHQLKGRPGYTSDPVPTTQLFPLPPQQIERLQGAEGLNADTWRWRQRGATTLAHLTPSAACLEPGGLENSAKAAPLSWKHYPHVEQNVPFQGSLHLPAPW